MYLVEFSKKSVYFFDVLIQRKVIMIVHNLVKKIQNDITFIEEDREVKKYLTRALLGFLNAFFNYNVSF